MINNENLIISLTTWTPRMTNIPTVLDTIFQQTISPDLVVLNLAKEDNIPCSLQEYIDLHPIEVNRVPNTKVYKKLLPTLRKYPNAIVISIDDDWLYPQGMIEDFVTTHNKYPGFPISGNRELYAGFQCHCGCASLTKAEYFGTWLDKIDADVIANCPSDDFVYTYFSNKAGHPYLRSKQLYFTNMQQFGAVESYSETLDSFCSPIELSIRYLFSRFGDVETRMLKYINDDSPERLQLINEIEKNIEHYAFSLGKHQCENTYSFKVGKCFVRPIRRLMNLFSHE